MTDWDYPVDEWRAVIDINLKRNFFLLAFSTADHESRAVRTRRQHCIGCG